MIFHRFRGETPRFTTEVIVSREILRFKSNLRGSKLSILDLMNTLSFSKNNFGQIWEKRILKWGNRSGIKLFWDFFYFGFMESTIKLFVHNFSESYSEFIHGVIGAKVTVRTFWHHVDFLTALVSITQLLEFLWAGLWVITHQGIPNSKLLSVAWNTRYPLFIDQLQ